MDIFKIIRCGENWIVFRNGLVLKSCFSELMAKLEVESLKNQLELKQLKMKHQLAEERRKHEEEFERWLTNGVTND